MFWEKKRKGACVMSRTKKILLIVSAACILAGLLLCFGAFAATGFAFAGLNTLTFESHTYTIEEPFVMPCSVTQREL